jgi:multiple sugar transport system permease protein
VATFKTSRGFDRVRVNRIVERVVFYLIMIPLSVAVVFPFFWLVRSSLMTQAEIFTIPIQWLPHSLLWSNFSDAFNTAPFGLYFRNSFILEALNITGTVLSASFVAFGFARIQFWGKNVLFYILISTLMLPSVVTLIPTFVIWHQIGAINTYFPLWVPAFFGNAFFIFMVRQFFMGIPRDYDEAALIDGANYLRIYWSIILPLSRPALVTVAMFTFLQVWNDFLTPLIYLNDSNMYTVALGLQAFIGQYNTQWNLLMAASTLAVLPVVILFFLGQRFFIEGATMTGIKG